MWSPVRVSLLLCEGASPTECYSVCWPVHDWLLFCAVRSAGINVTLCGDQYMTDCYPVQWRMQEWMSLCVVISIWLNVPWVVTSTRLKWWSVNNRMLLCVVADTCMNVTVSGDKYITECYSLRWPVHDGKCPISWPVHELCALSSGKYMYTLRD